VLAPCKMTAVPDREVDDILAALDKLASPVRAPYRPSPVFASPSSRNNNNPLPAKSVPQPSPSRASYSAQPEGPDNNLADRNALDEIEAALAALGTPVPPSATYGLHPKLSATDSLDELEQAIRDLRSPSQPAAAHPNVAPSFSSPPVPEPDAPDSTIDEIHAALNKLLDEGRSVDRDSIVDEIHAALNKLLGQSVTAHELADEIQNVIVLLSPQPDDEPTSGDAVDDINAALDRLCSPQVPSRPSPAALTSSICAPACAPTHTSTAAVESSMQSSSTAPWSPTMPRNPEVELKQTIAQLLEKATAKEVLSTLHTIVDEVQNKQHNSGGIMDWRQARRDVSLQFVTKLDHARNGTAAALSNVTPKTLIQRWRNKFSDFMNVEACKREAMSGGVEAGGHEQRWVRFEAAQLDWIQVEDFDWVAPSISEIRRLGENAFKKLALRWHPDKFSQKFGSKLFNRDRQQIHARINEVFRAIMNARSIK